VVEENNGKGRDEGYAGCVEICIGSAEVGRKTHCGQYPGLTRLWKMIDKSQMLWERGEDYCTA
jgi:hypothetical protein